MTAIVTGFTGTVMRKAYVVFHTFDRFIDEPHVKPQARLHYIFNSWSDADTCLQAIIENVKSIKAEHDHLPDTGVGLAEAIQETVSKLFDKNVDYGCSIRKYVSDVVDIGWRDDIASRALKGDIYEAEIQDQSKADA